MNRSLFYVYYVTGCLDLFVKHSLSNPCPKVPFRLFDKLKNDIRNFLLIYLNMKNEIQIIDYYFHV